MTLLTYSPAEERALVAAALADRARLTDPAAIDAAFVTIANIAARAELARIRRERARRAIRAAVRPFRLPIGEAA